MPKKTIGYYTATSLVIANMIGTGVFTSLGFQVLGIHSIPVLLLLWIVGGVIALCGALSYGELGAAMPRSGGEYNFLSRIYHPVLGYLAGWTSATVGFAAPVALAAMALGSYLSKVNPAINGTLIATGCILILTAVHAYDLKKGSRVQNIFTFIKLLLIVVFIVAGLFFSSTTQLISFSGNNFQQDPIGGWDMLFSPAFAISLIYVSYAYSGWNAAAYMAGEIENPKKNIPRALFTGTLVVLVLYVLLNLIFLKTVSINNLSGQLEIGYLSATNIFGSAGGNAMGIVIALLLVSSISSMIMAGPRVAQTMGEDITALKFLARKNKNGVPVTSIFVQSILTLLLIYTGSFERVMTYVGFTLSLFTFLTVLGVFINRFKNKTVALPYKTWGYPVVPIIFLALTLWTMVFVFIQKPIESITGIATILAGLPVYYLSKRKPLQTLNPSFTGEELPVQQ